MKLNGAAGALAMLLTAGACGAVIGALITRQHELSLDSPEQVMTLDEHGQSQVGHHETSVISNWHHEGCGWHRGLEIAPPTWWIWELLTQEERGRLSDSQETAVVKLVATIEEEMSSAAAVARRELDAVILGSSQGTPRVTRFRVDTEGGVSAEFIDTEGSLVLVFAGSNYSAAFASSFDKEVALHDSAFNRVRDLLRSFNASARSE